MLRRFFLLCSGAQTLQGAAQTARDEDASHVLLILLGAPAVGVRGRDDGRLLGDRPDHILGDPLPDQDLLGTGHAQRDGAEGGNRHPASVQTPSSSRVICTAAAAVA